MGAVDFAGCRGRVVAVKELFDKEVHEEEAVILSSLSHRCPFVRASAHARACYACSCTCCRAFVPLHVHAYACAVVRVPVPSCACVHGEDSVRHPGHTRFLASHAHGCTLSRGTRRNVIGYRC